MVSLWSPASVSSISAADALGAELGPHAVIKQGGTLTHTSWDRTGSFAMGMILSWSLANLTGLTYVGEFDEDEYDGAEDPDDPATNGTAGEESRTTESRAEAERRTLMYTLRHGEISLLRRIGLPIRRPSGLPHASHRLSASAFLQTHRDILRANPEASFHILNVRDRASNLDHLFDPLDNLLSASLRKELRRRARMPPPTLWKADAPLRVVVHVRRGDLLGEPKYFQYRLLPNQYYLRLLAIIREVEPDADVLVFGDNSSHVRDLGTWSSDRIGLRREEFRRHWRGGDRTADVDGGEGGEAAFGERLHLDGPLEEVWAHMATADVLILSKSCFSLVPALLGEAPIVIYPEPIRRSIIGFARPLRDWIVVDTTQDWWTQTAGESAEEAMQRVIETMVGERTERQLKDKLVLRLSGGSGVVDTPLMDEL